MAQVTLKGKPLLLEGELPQNGQPAPNFRLVAQDLTDLALENFGNKIKILLTVPSLDTPVCAVETRKFHEKIDSMKEEGLVLIVASGDLPFAMKRFCSTEGLENVFPASQYRDPAFSKSYGVHIKEGGLQGLCARAVFVIDKENKIRYTELVPEIGQEPDYEKALAAVEALRTAP